MKFFGKVSLKLFSLIIFVLSIAIILMGLNLINTNLFTKLIDQAFENEMALRITLIVSSLLLILATRYLLFKAYKSDEMSARDGIVMENANGKLIISKESLENMILTSAKTVEGIEYINSKTLLDTEHRLIIYVTVVALDGVIVKEVSKQLQDKIKETMKNTADLEVVSVTLNVKNIVSKKSKFDKKNNKKNEIKEEVSIPEVEEEQEIGENQENEEETEVEILKEKEWF